MDIARHDPRPVVAATLRTVAEWGLSFDNGPASDQLRGIADQVERLQPDEPCCPVCEEVECDEHCPLAAWRADPPTT